MVSPICYLCGQSIEADSTLDHVPPQQFVAPDLRRAHNLSRLLTLPAHKACNHGYSRDEEYFAWSLAPLAAGTTAADALNAYNAVKFQAGRNVPLGIKVLKEFDQRPSGLHLPAGLVVKRIEGERIRRVAWKIVRGLFFHETGRVLPEPTTFAMDIIEPSRRDPTDLDDLWEAVRAQPSRGVYGGIFDYKYLHLEVEGDHLHGWGMLLWDRVMVFIGHHHPASADDAA